MYTKDYLQLQIDGSGWSYGSDWGDLMESAILEWFGAQISDKNTKILDFGCGEGRGVLALKNAGFNNVVGLDLNEEKTRVGRSKGLDLICGNLKDIQNLCFDYVFTSHTLEHLPNIADGIDDLVKVCNGFIYYIVPIRETKEFVMLHNPSHMSFINDPKEFLDILDAKKLEHVSKEVDRLCSELWGIIKTR